MYDPLSGGFTIVNEFGFAGAVVILLTDEPTNPTRGRAATFGVVALSCATTKY